MGQVLIRFAAGRLRAYVPGGFTFVAARDIVERSLNIAADICIYTNRNLTIEEIGA